MPDQVVSYRRSLDLPEFKYPPVTQVDIGLHIQALKLRAVHLGGLHERFREDYPLIEEHPPLPMQIERFQGGSPSGIQFQFQLLDRPLLPMLVLLTEDRSSLVQVDNTRFFCAWRRSSGDVAYPRYENIRAEFLRNVEKFDQFTIDVNAEAKSIVQAEISYINDISVGRGMMSDFLAYEAPIFDDGDSEDQSKISAVSFMHHITYKNSRGIDYARLHISAEPITVGAESVLRLSLVYRGEPRERHPDEDALDAAMLLLDEGHDRMVRAFAEYTKPEAHLLWGRVAR